MPRRTDEIYEFGDFRLDVGQRKIERTDDSQNGSLPEKAFQTLLHLVRNSGTLVLKDELLSVIWPDTVVEENNLGKAVHAIRHFLGEGSREYIETVPKHGYRFVAPVVRVGAGNIPPDRARSPAVRSPAWDLYLRGKVKASSENKEDTEAAIEVLERAVQIDPELAGAYAQLARAYNTLAFKFSSDAAAKQLHEDAEVAILKSLALDPDLADGHFARGLILWTKRKGFPHEQAIKSYQRSLELDPNEDETHHQLSMVYSHIGLVDEAIERVQYALDLNPNNTMARFRSGLYQAYTGRFETALQIFRNVPRDVSPLLVDRSTADVLVQLGRLGEADEIVDHYLDEYPQDEGGSFTSVKAVILAKKGRTGEAEDAAKHATAIGSGFGHFHHTAHNIAAAYAAMGKIETAVSWLEKAADDGFPNLTYFEIDPNLDPIRESPEFIEFLRKLRPQWLRYREVAAA
ncbi:MAG TPA: winged helix-turn-helix domain-containing protein [Pyrinomonadaceae bacterium]|nr:winged helix-turn-helix domain-containing protein [Pyrinomonadaceae bacterium]